MSFVSVITHNYSVFHRALIFLLRLAGKSRVRLPYLIIVGFMALDVRLVFETVADEIPPPDNGYQQSGSSSDSEDSYDFQEILH